MLVKLQLSGDLRTAKAWACVRGRPEDWKPIGEHTFGESLRYVGLAASSHNKAKEARVLFGILEGPTDFAGQTKIGPGVSGQSWDKGALP